MLRPDAKSEDEWRRAQLAVTLALFAVAAAFAVNATLRGELPSGSLGPAAVALEAAKETLQRTEQAGLDSAQHPSEQLVLEPVQTREQPPTF